MGGYFWRNKKPFTNYFKIQVLPPCFWKNFLFLLNIPSLVSTGSDRMDTQYEKIFFLLHSFGQRGSKWTPKFEGKTKKNKNIFGLHYIGTEVDCFWRCSENFSFHLFPLGKAKFQPLALKKFHLCIWQNPKRKAPGLLSGRSSISLFSCKTHSQVAIVIRTKRHERILTSIALWRQNRFERSQTS